MSVRRAVYTAVLIITLVSMTGCQKNISYKDTAAFTLDDSKVYFNEMMYHVLLARMQDELYASYMGDRSDESNKDITKETLGTPSDNKELQKDLKESAIENAVKYELFYELAVEKGYTLTEEEKAQSLESVKTFQLNFGEDTLLQYGLDKETLTAIQDKIILAARYYSDYTESLGISEEKVRTELNKADFKQYKMAYLYAGKAKKEELTKLADSAKTENFSTLTENTNIKAGEITFLAGTNTFGEEKILEETISGMAEGEVSDVIETVNGYYILKLEKDTSEDAFEKAVKEEYDRQRTEAGEKGYEELKRSHSIEFNKQLEKTIEIVK